jgi:predicted nuclease with TOPRIM domain
MEEVPPMFNVIEKLNEEYSELQDKYSILEDKYENMKKECEKFKLLFAECDNHLHYWVQGQIEEQWHDTLRYSGYPEDNEAYQIYLGLDALICEHMLPESVEIWNKQNILRLKEGWIIKHYAREYEMDHIYIQMKDKDIKDLQIVS